MRKIETMKDARELNLDGKSASTIAVHRYSVPVLVTAARCGELTKLAGIGDKKAEDIYRAIDEADFILHESAISLAMRNLLATAFYFPLGTPEEYEARVEFTEEQRVALFKLLETVTDREQEVLKLRFGLDGATPMNRSQIATKLGVTREAIRQLEANACRKLRHPTRQRVLQVIFPDWPGFEMKLPVRTGVYDGPLEDMPLEEMACLSVRAYNCLVRAKICTVGQLIQYTYAEVRAIRNMTIRATENIVASLLGIGCELKAEDERGLSLKGGAENDTKE